MNVFAVLPPEPNATLDKLIEDHFAGNCLKLAPAQWLVAGKATSRDISDLLQITTTEDGKVSRGATGNAVIVAVSSYFGLAQTNIWEWLKTKIETPQP